MKKSFTPWKRTCIPWKKTSLLTNNYPVILDCVLVEQIHYSREWNGLSTQENGHPIGHGDTYAWILGFDIFGILGYIETLHFILTEEVVI